VGKGANEILRITESLIKQIITFSVNRPRLQRAVWEALPPKENALDHSEGKWAGLAIRTNEMLLAHETVFTFGELPVIGINVLQEYWGKRCFRVLLAGSLNCGPTQWVSCFPKTLSIWDQTVVIELRNFNENCNAAALCLELLGRPRFEKFSAQQRLVMHPCGEWCHQELRLQKGGHNLLAAFWWFCQWDQSESEWQF